MVARLGGLNLVYKRGLYLTITTSFRESVKPYLVQGGGSIPTPAAPSGNGSIRQPKKMMAPLS